jgi:hypothetical protein
MGDTTRSRRLFWWPKRRDELLANADRASDIATHIAEKVWRGP